MKALYEGGVHFVPDLALKNVRREGNRLVATLRNMYTERREELAADHIVVEHGTLPADELYHALKGGSRNHGEIDLDALLAGRPQGIDANPAGRYQLFRVGDAVASRNIHARRSTIAAALQEFRGNRRVGVGMSSVETGGRGERRGRRPPRVAGDIPAAVQAAAQSLAAGRPRLGRPARKHPRGGADHPGRDRDGRAAARGARHL